MTKKRVAEKGVSTAASQSDRYSPLPPPVEPLPRHIAFIMDGNGRWAKRQGFLRLRGHKLGAKSLRRVTRYCARIGIEEITFYALSTENYRRRPRTEVDYLMKLLTEFLIEERQELADGNVRLKAMGRTDELPEGVQKELATTIAGSAAHSGMVLRLCLNYGSRAEIVDAACRLADQIRSGEQSIEALNGLDEETFRRFLYDPSMSDPDLVVRTAGETRLSNFLLWQASYAEIFATDVLWPDFDTDDVDAALEFYAGCVRKFGSLGGEK